MRRRSELFWSVHVLGYTDNIIIHVGCVTDLKTIAKTSESVAHGFVVFDLSSFLDTRRCAPNDLFFRLHFRSTRGI
jgi:hypothetical protein